MTKPSGPSGAFFDQLIDYAGLFPPAALGVSDAVRNYRAYLDSSNRWMLGRFIGATAHVLGLTEEQLALFSAEMPLQVSLVTRDPVADIPKVVEKVGSAGGRLVISALEVVLPVSGNFSEALTPIENAVVALDRSGRKVPIFFELGAGEGWDDKLSSLLNALRDAHGKGRVFGFKLRCGGLEPHLIPSPDRVASALTAAAKAGVPVKFTAGLHHPFRHPQAHPFPPMHGYINIFFAAFVAYLKRPSVSELVSIVSEMERCVPVVGPQGIAWLGFELSADEIASAREQFALSYGSCSFIEPIDDARALGWL